MSPSVTIDSQPLNAPRVAYKLHEPETMSFKIEIPDVVTAVVNDLKPTKTRSVRVTLPSLSPVADNTLPARTKTPVSPASHDALFRDMLTTPLALPHASVTTVKTPKPAYMLCSLVTSSRPAKRKTYALDTDPVNALFAPDLPDRDPHADNRNATRAHCSLISCAVLASMLLDACRTLTPVRSFAITRNAKHAPSNVPHMIIPNTDNASTVIIAFAVMLRPARDIITLALIDALHDALDLPRPDFDRPSDMPSIKLS